ncbi:helix-turn-helix domain-containing protein [Paraburkholderia unamae]|uniref:helix-turn-helix domain-containing protein n=1 Tax=Paraburkholderia unamae TaxID=219649 RepID=UPI0035A22D20
MERAAALPQQTGRPQETIAVQSGFRSVDALQRAFRRERNCTPEEYRVSAHIEREGS